MSPASRHRFAISLLFIAPALWSANYIVARSAAGIVPPHALAFWRWLVALLLMLVISGPELKRTFPSWRKEWPDFLVLGGLGMWICGAFVYIGAQTTTALNIGLIYAACPVLIALFAHWVFNERLGRLQILGIALCLTGVIYVITKGELAKLRQVNFIEGDFWIAAAAASWVAYSLLLRRRKTVLEPFARLTCITAGGLVVLSPFVAWETLTVGPAPLTLQSIGFILIVALLPGFGAYQAYSYMQKELGTARTSLVLYLGPPYAALTGWLFLSEQPKVYHYLGGALVLLGIFLSGRRSPQKANTR